MVAQENGTCLGREPVHVSDAVLLLGLDCIFMLPAHAVQIIIHRGQGRYTCLGAFPHPEFIDIIAALLIADKDALFLPCFIKLCRMVIDLLGIHILSRRKGRFRPVYIEEA